MKIDSTTVAVITGGASGLGAATARVLAKHGARVALFDVNVEKGEALASEIAGVFCKVDINSDAEVDAGFDKSRKAFGQERILVNCAGVGQPTKTVSRDKKTGEIRRYPMEVYLRVVGTNLIGTFRCIAASTAGMLTLDPLNEDGARGVIINTASIAAQDGQIGQVAYAASKGGIVAMTLPIARDLMNEGIRVNTIMPGIFDTPLMMGAPESVKNALAEMVPFPRRFGKPIEYADLALELIRNEYLNGEAIRLDGAVRMPPR